MTCVSGEAETTKLYMIKMRPRSDNTPVDWLAIPGECCVTQYQIIRVGFQSEHYEEKGGQRRKEAEILEAERRTSKTGIYFEVGV